MPNWKHEINLNSVWESEDVQLVSKTIVNQLKSLPTIRGKEDLIEDFESLAEDKEAGFDAFNYVFDMLYDWADEHRVWIKIYF